MKHRFAFSIRTPGSVRDRWPVRAMLHPARVVVVAALLLSASLLSLALLLANGAHLWREQRRRKNRQRDKNRHRERRRAPLPPVNSWKIPQRPPAAPLPADSGAVEPTGIANATANATASAASNDQLVAGA